MLGVAFVVAGCSASDATTSGSSPEAGVDSDAESDGDVFSEAETATEQAADGDSGEAVDSDEADDTTDDATGDATDDESEAGTDEEAAADPDAAGDTIDSSTADAAASDPESSSGGSDPGNDGDTDGEDSGAADPAPNPEPEPDELDDLDDLIAIDEVDDVPFCQSYARVFESFVAISLGGAFGEVGSDDPDALVSLTETYEVILYPGLAVDVETIRGEGGDELDQFFGPLFERIDAAPGLLREAGLSDAEIADLTDGVRATDLDSIDLDGLDPRVTTAATAMVAEFGAFFDAADALAGPVENEDAAQDRIEQLCPLLADSFAGG